MTMPIEQVLASIVLVAAFLRMAWLLARPPHRTRAYWSTAQVRVDDWLTSHVHTRV